MPDEMGLTRQQTKFLRSLRATPVGVESDEHPSGIVLRRWMRRRRFRVLLNSIQATLQKQSDLHLTALAVTVAERLLKMFNEPGQQPTRDEIAPYVQVLRMSHLRTKQIEQKQKLPIRFKPPLINPIHPNHSLTTARRLIERLRTSTVKVEGGTDATQKEI